MLILTFTSGVAAQGLLVFAQKTIQIGTIGIAQVAQPALAVVWSFLLLGEVVNGRQVAGIAIVIGGLLAFVVRAPARERVGPVALGDEVRRRPPCAGRRRRQVAAVGVARLGRSARARRARRPRPGASPSRRASSRIAREPLLRAGHAVAASSAASRQSPSAACSPPPASRCHAAAASSAARASASGRARAGRGRGGPARARPAARRRSPPPCAIPSSSVAAPRLVVAGLALRAAEARHLVGLGLEEAEPPRRLGRPAEVADGVVEAVLEAGQLAEHRVAADVQPRVVDRREPALRPRRAPRRRARASPAEIAARAANSAFAAWSHGRSSPS